MEQMIIFVYDTKFCQSEEDDPQKAVLFFHPKWVSDQQRLALCGQLMGAAHFCSSVFSTPQVLTLQSGKFMLKKFGRFIMSVGSDQTLPDWILNERFNMLQSLIEFYHKSFESILSSVNSKYELFTKKLCDIFEVYSPIIEFIVSQFGNAPILKFPRKKSNVFLEAFQLLESCCTFEGVLGGTILNNGRVIATLLDSDVTKILAITDPHRIRCGAEEIKTPFRLPLGVQLVKVHVKQTTCDSSVNFGVVKPSFSLGTKKEERVLQESDSKREVGKIFTVPEEEDGNNSGDFVKGVKNLYLKELNRKKNRKYTKTKLENNGKERSRNFTGSHNIKICSTPTVEKKLVHEDVVSICGHPKTDTRPTPQPSHILDSMQTTVKANPVNKSLPSKHTYNCLYRMSMDDQMIDFSHGSYPMPLRYYSFGLPKICKELDQTIKDGQKKGKLYKSKFYKTIADPSNPVFRYDGFPVSKSLYNHCLDEHYKDFIMANITIDSREEFIKRKNLENELNKIKNDNNAKSKDMSNKNECATRTGPCNVDSNAKPGENCTGGVNEMSTANQKLFRRSLTLPLKSVSYTTSENSVPMAVVKNKVLNCRTPTTPLMTKLSLLVMEEENEKRCSGVSQHSQSRTKLLQDDQLLPVKKDKTGETENSGRVSCGLFVCGHQNMTMLLLLEENAEQNPDLILSLWDMCTSNLDKVELLKNKNADNFPCGGVGSTYSFLSLDPQWGAMQKSGIWGNDEIKAVGSLHQDMIFSPNITEIIIRNEDAVIYGYRCGNTETFYHQGGCTAVGLPTPADLMGVIPLKARRRLERDHGVILL